ncbi:MAG: carboxylating nicotinate-nucleotide diphosphorylase [candidate division NC10 bacterium]|nr:carboxylating nicotinate-nucleotide diphosphorylase [candidate division NC10 bacterium]
MSREELAAIPLQVRRLIEAALEEDVASGDPTTEALVLGQEYGRAEAVARAPGVLAGTWVFAAVLTTYDPRLQVDPLRAEGSQVAPGEGVVAVSGSLASILKAERVALNFLQRLSGIATETARYVAAVAGLPVRIADTRKTVPGMRWLEKYAVRMGGGTNHRMSLSDGILVKDNHLAVVKARGETFKAMVARLRQRTSHLLKIQVEVETLEEATEATEGGADALLLDQMPIEEIEEVVRRYKGRILIEASGGITLENVRRVAETGVDLISVGALTHSPRALDISLEMYPP